MSDDKREGQVSRQHIKHQLLFKLSVERVFRYTTQDHLTKHGEHFSNQVTKVYKALEKAWARTKENGSS